jgi:hypothetical protein
MFDSTVAEPPNSMESRGGFGWVLSNAPVSAGASPQEVEDERKESHQGPRPFGRPKKQARIKESGANSLKWHIANHNEAQKLLVL